MLLRSLSLVFVILILAPGMLVGAQSSSLVQEIQGNLEPGEVDVFLLEGLKQGQSVYAYMETTAGNLDPILAMVDAETDLESQTTAYAAEVQELARSAEHPLLELPAVRDRYFLAWDDDSGEGYSAALKFTVPQDGDYFLLASTSLGSAGRQTRGSYRLLVGLDAPDVLSGKAESGEVEFLRQDQESLGQTSMIQEHRGSLSEQKPEAIVQLLEPNPGDTLSLYLQATSGDLRPVVVLRDYGGKPLRVGNLNGQASQASLEYTFPEGGSGYTLEIRAYAEGDHLTSGDYRLLVGRNAPQVLDGQGEPNSDRVMRLPIQVSVGLKLEQIVSIDQANEILTAVGTLGMEWSDPDLAFNPDDCHCSMKEYNDRTFNDFLKAAEGKWPEYMLFNQQGNRWVQNRILQVEPTGHVRYLERFTTNFQVDFDYQQFPLDTQDFYFIVDLLPAEDLFVFSNQNDYSEISPYHGEDEFVIGEFDTQVSSESVNQKDTTSRFTFHFSAPRHLEYYVFQIFVPIFLIISISYVTFFLKDFGRRIEIATGNLLLFIAYSFSLANNYPRLGYLTFLDAIMAVTFAVNTLVVVYNVYLKWLETRDQLERAERIDRVFDWIYPITYLVAFTIIYFWFFRV